MKRWLIVLLALLVLTGCSQQPESTTADTTPPPTEPPVVLYRQNSILEQTTGGAVRCYSLGTDGCLGVQPFGQNILTVSLGANGSSELMVISADSGTVLATASLEGIQADSVLAGQDRVACYSVAENCVTVLDAQLKITDRIYLSKGIVGDVLVDPGVTTVYYCTENQIRATDMATDTPRLLHQHDGTQLLDSVILNGQVLVCRVTDSEGDYYEFIDTQTGQTLGKDEELLAISAWEDRYFLRRLDHGIEENIFSTGTDPLQQLNLDGSNLYPVPAVNGVVSVSDPEAGLQLRYFDLQTGLLRSSATLQGLHSVYSICALPQSGTVWFVYEDADLCEDILCQWDTALLETDDQTVYTTRRYTAEDPDTEGLAVCGRRAAELREAYGISIVFDASVKPSSDYVLKPEFQVELVNRGLDALQEGLASLPEGFVKELSTISDAPLQISLVRSIQDVAGQVPSDGTGLQYWSGGDACIALCVTDTILSDFYHQLFHVLETYLYSESSALDLWENLNPKGFAYDYNYLDHTRHADSKYLEGSERAVIDTYSMTFPREDRARIFEYAMQSGNEELFASDTMQDKLHQLSYCIRQAYGWRKSELVYPWEQYLEESLAYTKRK